MRVFAIFSGSSYGPPSNGAESIEVHESIRAAADSLAHRDRMNGRPLWDTITYADGHGSDAAFPAMSEGDSLTLWAAPDNGALADIVADLVAAGEITTDDERRQAWHDALAQAAEEAIGLGTPDYVLTIGPRGGIRRERV